MTQQELLRFCMERLSWTRQEIIDHMGADYGSKRTLDAWLLPISSKHFREMSSMALDRVRQILHEHAIKEQHMGTQATLASGVPVVICPKPCFRFPTIYRVSSKIGHLSYTLTDQITPEELGFVPDMIAPVARRVASTDKRWVFVTEHVNYDRAEAYCFALYQTNPDWRVCPIRIYSFEERIFTLLERDPAQDARHDVVTLYQSDFYLFDERRPGDGGDSWSCVFGPDGEEIETWDMFIDPGLDIVADSTIH